MVTPDELQGRVNASHRFFIFGAGALGGLLGGVVGGTLGLRPTLLAGAIGMLVARVWLLLTSVPRLRDQPTQADTALSPGR